MSTPELNKHEDGIKQNSPIHSRKQCSPNSLTTGKCPLRKCYQDNVDDVSGKELTMRWARYPARPQDKPPHAVVNKCMGHVHGEGSLIMHVTLSENCLFVKARGKQNGI